ncbi:hypothetical protein Leryth_012657 [Lithospermum erythrorhizon]|nr:hypothetical protein Leryth_012657 [Lithospermum erythrorhizon]
MISILCEALGLASKMFMVPNYFVPLLGGIAKVLGSIRRHHFEQFKVAVPIILNVLKAIALDLDVEDIDCEDLFNKTIDIAHSIQAINVKLEGEDGKQSSALFSLFILETMYLVTIGMRNKVSSCASLVLQLSHFLRLCNLSYVGLIMERDIDTITKIALRDDGDYQTGCFSHVKHGSALAVIWGFKSDEIAMAAEADFTLIRRELQSDQTKRWQAVGKMKYIFISTAIPWELKKFAINFILAILDGNSRHISQDKYEDYSIYTPTLYSSLQGIQMVIMYSPEAGLRKHAFEAFKNVLGDVPASIRFDILEALIKNSDSSSMIAILLHCVKEEMHAEMRNIRSEVSEENGTARCTAFWNTTVLEVIQSVLRPPKGGPPDLPEYGDAVLSCLNLYRFILITESSGKTNYTGALLKDSLQRAYDEWLLPLRTLVTGIVAENEKDHDQLASDTVCALNPIELVMYRCIELVEENLKHQI